MECNLVVEDAAVDVDAWQLAARYLVRLPFYGVGGFAAGIGLLAVGIPEWISDAVVFAVIMLPIKVFFDARQQPVAKFWTVWTGLFLWSLLMRYFFEFVVG